jgi:hypothetical protein
MLALLLAAVGGAAGFALPWPGPNPRFRRPAAARVSASGELDDHISIDLGYPGIKRLYSSVAARCTARCCPPPSHLLLLLPGLPTSSWSRTS